MATTEKKYLSYTGLSHYDEKIKKYIDDGDAAALKSAKDYADSLASNYDAAGAATSAVEALDSSVAVTTAEGKTYVLTGVTQTDGKLTGKTEIELAKVATTGAAADVAVADAAGKLEATTVEAALTEIVGMVEDAESAGEIILDHTAGSLTYTLYQGQKDNDHKIGQIDIPADMVATSGSLYVATASDTGLTSGETYIKMIIANGDPFYIPVQGLIDIYQGSGDVATVSTGIEVKVSDAGVISATLKSVDGSLIDAGSVAEAKLDSSVQAKLAKAASAVQSVTETAATGTNGTITVDGSEVAVKGLGSAAYTEASAYDASGAAAAVKSEIMGNASTDTSASKTIEGLVKADAALSDRIDALEGVSYVEITNAEVDSLFSTASE